MGQYISQIGLLFTTLGDSLRIGVIFGGEIWGIRMNNSLVFLVQWERKWIYPKVRYNFCWSEGYYWCDLNCVTNMAALMAENGPPHFVMTNYISCLLLEVFNSCFMSCHFESGCLRHKIWSFSLLAWPPSGSNCLKIFCFQCDSFWPSYFLILSTTLTPFSSAHFHWT